MSSSSSSSAAVPKVSFTIRRPTPNPMSRQGSSGPDSDRESNFKVPALPRHISDSGRTTPTSPLVNGHSGSKSAKIKSKGPYQRYDNSSDDDEGAVDEIVTGFDQFGVQRLVEKKQEGPLIIPALANRDWRDVARKRKAGEMFVPESARAATGADGSVGGLGTRGTINSGPTVAGLVKKEKRLKTEDDMDEDSEPAEPASVQPLKEETDDEKALRLLISAAKGDDGDATPAIEIIPTAGNDWARARPADETDAYRRDVVTRPDVATLDDYDRVPVEAFGAALLRGMGWKPGTAASRTRSGPAEPWLPTARPALLGIGAKERVVEDDGSKDKKSAGKKRPERRYVPVVKKEREGSSSAPVSRRASASPEPERRRDREYDRGSERHRDREYESDRERDRHRDRDSGSRRERDRDSDRGGRRDRDRHSDRGKDRDSDRRR